MSSDENTQNKNEPVDVDQLEVKIFIIARKPEQLQSAAQFLSRRGWPTQCVGNISKAIGTIVKESPDIVLISVDHPNPNVTRLPILLAQTLNTLCVGFTEDGGALSISKLNNSRFKHKFNGFPSGPSIHRFIRQTLDNIYNPQETAVKAKNKNSASNDENSTIKVKGEKGDSAIKISGETESEASGTSGSSIKRKKLKDFSSQSSVSKDGLSAAEMLQKLSQGDDYDPIKKQNNKIKKQSENKNKLKERNSSSFEEDNSSTDASKKESPDNQGYFQGVLKNAGTQLSEKERLEKKARVEAKKKAFPWQKNSNVEDTPIKNQQKRPGATFNLKQGKDKLQPDSDEPMFSTGSKSESQMEMQQGTKSKTGLYVPKPGEKKKKNFDIGTEDKLEKSGLDVSEQKSNKNKSANHQNSSENISKKMHEESGLNLDRKTLANFDTEDKETQSLKKRVNKSFVASGKKLTEEEDKFKESVHKALKESCEEPDPKVLIEIDEVEQLGVIPVDSQKIHGYFLIGRGGIGFSLGTIFLEIMCEAIEKHLAMKGIDVHCQKPFLVDTDSFDFNNWAQTVENFTIFEQSAREEIALTFIPTKDRIPHLIDSEKDPEMAKIDASHLSTSNPLNFDSFIHLEKNSKFYKYIKTGSKILPRQKEKLKNTKDLALHINKSEFENFKKYVAEILIKELIKKVNSSNEDAA